MKPRWPLMWPLLVGTVSLAFTGWLWQHENQLQERQLRSNFNFGLRLTASGIQERVASYEQMLRGARGLFEASPRVTQQDFGAYVDALSAGADFAGLRCLAYLPVQHPDTLAAEDGDRVGSAAVAFAAPAPDSTLLALGDDPAADPAVQAAMRQARDSGGIAITAPLRTSRAASSTEEAGLLLFMPLYAKGLASDSVAARRAHLRGWVLASFRIGDLMSSLYGEVMPGLDVQLHDGVEISAATRMYPPAAAAGAPRTARFEALEYLSVAGHTWTASVRSQRGFEQQFNNNSARIIAFAGSGLSLALALLTWQLVTGRERAQASAREMTRQLRESAERYRRIVDTANEGIWMVDAQGCTSFSNPKLQQMLGYRADELQGRHWSDFTDEAGRSAIAGAAQQTARRGLAERLDLRFRRKDGGELIATLSTSPITDEAGRHAGELAMVTDVTERAASETRRDQLEAQLRQAQKMEAIGTLAGGIAHDFNNILAAILGNVGLALQDLVDGHPARARLGQIQLAGERGRSLVQQIAAFSRQQPQQRLNQPLRPLLEEAARLLRSTLPAQVELELRLSDAPLHVNADATQLQQVLMNLCTNAWHAMTGDTGRIVIGLDSAELDAEAAARAGGLAAGRYVHVWVNDDGKGMDEATRLRIFEPFYTTKPVGQGTGLGLSVVHGIVTAHGGGIMVDSVSGRGSTFGLFFPPAAPPVPSAAPGPAVPQVPRGAGQLLLYVDDDPVMVVMTQALLQSLGYRVAAVGDPRQALQRAVAADDPVDLVVTDFNMPEMSGLGLAAELHRRRPGLPVIISSGDVSDRLRNEALSAGVRYVLQKEFTLERLGALVHQVLLERAAAADPAANARPR